MVACGFEPGRDVAIALDVAVEPLLRPRDRHLSALTATGDEALDSRRHDRAARPTGSSRYPIVSIEDGLAEDDWDGWTALTDAARRLGPAHRRRPVRDPVGRLRTGDRDEGGQRDPDQGEPGRHAHRDARRARSWPAATAIARSSRPARARPRTRRSPTSPSPPPPARSRSARSPAPSGWPSTTACSGSRRPWGRTRRSRVVPRSRGQGLRENEPSPLLIAQLPEDRIELLFHLTSSAVRSPLDSARGFGLSGGSS